MECPHGHKNCPIIREILEEIKKAAPMFWEVSNNLRQRKTFPERERFEVGVKIIDNIVTKVALMSGKNGENNEK